MPRWSIADYRSPGAGLASGHRPHLVRADEFVMMQNMWLRNGVVIKRGGSVAQGNAPDAAVVRWLAHAYDTAGSSIRNRLRFCNGKLQWLSVATWTDIAGATGYTATTYPVSVQYQDKVFWVDAVNTPQQITIAATPTTANWTTMPSGINPSWVVLHDNRLYIGNDTSTPQQVWVCDPGTPATFQATEFFQIPDNQNGNFPKIGVNCGRGILLVCQDFLVYLTGDGGNSWNLWHYPRGAACTAWRSVVNMGDFGVVYLTERGLFNTDGTSPPEPIDPYGKVNWGDIDLGTETDTHAVRYGDLYILFYKQRGTSTSATAQTAYLRSASWTVSANAGAIPITRWTQAAAASQTSHFIAYDCRLKQFVGAGTAPYSCAAWEQYRSGDTQDLWVGSATTVGKVLKWDQPGTWQDDGADYECILKTGSVAPDPFMLYTVDKAALKASSIVGDDAVAEVRVYFNGLAGEADAAWKRDVRVGTSGQMGDETPYEPEANLTDEVVRNVRPPQEDAARKGVDPQVEVRVVCNTGFEYRGLSVNTTPRRGEE